MKIINFKNLYTMKKSILFLICILSVSLSFSQSNTAFGLRVIPTFDWTRLTDTSYYSYDHTGVKAGIGFGPSLRYEVSENFNVDVSGIFTWQRTGIHQTFDLLGVRTVDRTEDIKIQYLKIPLNFNGQFTVYGDIQALINFGLGAGIKLSSYRQVTDNILEFTNDYEDVRAINFVDIYLAAGLGLVYNIDDNLHLSVTGQYNNGVLDGWLNNRNDEPLSFINDLTMKHRNIALNIGFYIDF
jgi:hypothetical protein